MCIRDSISIGSQAADTSIRGKSGKRHLQAEIVSGELIKRRGTSHTDFLGLRAEEKLNEVVASTMVGGATLTKLLGTSAVSYTHLDVYKRQVLACQ